MLKEAATRGKAATVRDFLEAGIPLEPLRPTKAQEPSFENPLDSVGWLTAASRHPETLQAFIEAKASENDQGDKDLALAGAARSGDLGAARALIGYGANPNADLSKRAAPYFGGPVPAPPTAARSVLIEAASSGNPDMVRLILGYHPDLEKRDGEGKTAMFAAAEHGTKARENEMAESLRLLAEAGADVNARDNNGNTPLHEANLTGVEEELLKLGADVNARNNDGETPIFTTFDPDAIALFIKHGADLTIRNNKGQTVMEAAKNKGPAWQEALRKAIQKPPSQ